jgi:NTE family protein
MGEPPRNSDMEIAADKNMRLRRPPGWKETADSQSDFQLSDAVAASACVPGLFHPMAVSDMYEDYPFNGKLEEITPQLVDGGVHDNLGIAALLDVKAKNTGGGKEREYCENIIISDASGQMEDDPNPSTNILKVITRMNGILMDRIREEELFRLFEQCDKPPKKFAFMHLRKRLPRREVRYLDQDNQPGEADSTAGTYLNSPEDFGVPLEVQEHLSRFRTDLDSFTDVEAQSLMLDAYLMCIQEINRRFEKTPLIRPKGDWKFMVFKPVFEELIKKSSGEIPPEGGNFKTEKYLKHLKTASKTTFKVFFLSPFKAFPSLIVIYVIPILLLGWIFRDFLANQISAFLSRPIGDFLPELIVLAVGLALGSISPFVRWLKRILPKSTFSIIIKFLTGLGRWSRIWIHIFTRFLWPTLGWVIILIHLKVFDRFFINSGRFEKFEKAG